MRVIYILEYMPLLNRFPAPLTVILLEMCLSKSFFICRLLLHLGKLQHLFWFMPQQIKKVLGFMQRRPTCSAVWTHNFGWWCSPKTYLIRSKYINTYYIIHMYIGVISSVAMATLEMSRHARPRPFHAYSPPTNPLNLILATLKKIAKWRPWKWVFCDNQLVGQNWHWQERQPFFDSCLYLK